MTLILVVENTEDCIAEMRQALSTVSLGLQVVFKDNVPDAIAWLSRHLKDVGLISMDHDLGPEMIRDGESFDPGNGQDIVNYLAERPPQCAVLLHTDNFFVRPQLQQRLADAGWDSFCLNPGNGLGWISRDWLPTVLHLLSTTERSASPGSRAESDT